MTRLSGKIVIVTGAGTGIGAATVRRFVEEGAKVVLVGRTLDNLENAVSGLPETQSVLHPADVCEESAVMSFNWLLAEIGLCHVAQS